MNNEDVLDETYRKAGKMDVKNFASKFVVSDLGLDVIVRNRLLEGRKGTKPIKVELYKLNVYGKLSATLSWITLS